MSVYAAADEEKIRDQALVREWSRSGLMSGDQAARLEAELRVNLRRTNGFLRAVLCLFTMLIAGASVFLVHSILDVHERSGEAAIGAFAGVVFWVIAEFLIAQKRLYRFGVEEALGLAAVVCISVSIATFAQSDAGIAWNSAIV